MPLGGGGYPTTPFPTPSQFVQTSRGGPRRGSLFPGCFAPLLFLLVLGEQFAGGRTVEVGPTRGGSTSGARWSSGTERDPACLTGGAQPAPLANPPDCRVCGGSAPGIPYPECLYCGESPSHHHGKCCPERPEFTYGDGQRSSDPSALMWHALSLVVQDSVRFVGSGKVGGGVGWR